jgi:1-deoxy-D-xylulose-5-phosphate synthase
MCEGSGMTRFAQAFPQRYHDVGIAEQHAVTFAAGLACGDMKPVVAIYSTFLQRAYDQLIHDVALQNLDVTFAIDRGGLVGADGATHQGAFDLSYLACIPNMVVMTPADEAECRRMLTTAYQHPGPAAVRYPRGAGPAVTPAPSLDSIAIGKGEIRRPGKRVAILAFGTLLAAALEAGEVLDASVANMRFVKPLDLDLLRELAETHECLVSIEENAVIGGAGAELVRALETMGIVKPLLRLGLPDSFVEQGEQAQMLAELGLNPVGIVARIEKFRSLHT